MDIIWDGERLVVAGPDTVPNPTAAEGPFVVGVRFQPGMGPRFLGVPADELRDRWVDLDWLWTDAGVVAEELAARSTLRHAAAVLEARISRETRILAGRTPAELRAARLRVRNVQDA